MQTTKPTNAHPFHILVPTEPVDLWTKLKQLASRNRRTIKQETEIAIENHLKEGDVLTPAEIKKLESR